MQIDCDVSGKNELHSTVNHSSQSIRDGGTENGGLGLAVTFPSLYLRKVRFPLCPKEEVKTFSEIFKNNSLLFFHKYKQTTKNKHSLNTE